MFKPDCGDVRSRTSYNDVPSALVTVTVIVVTSDLGRVTTIVLTLTKRIEALW